MSEFDEMYLDVEEDRIVIPEAPVGHLWPVINPMLCKTYNPLRHQIEAGWWLEPKLDGLRGVLVRDEDQVGVFSRLGNPFWNWQAIGTQVEALPYRNYVLDGEFFISDGDISWNTTMSVLRRQEAHPHADKLTFRVFDVILLEAWLVNRDNRPQVERRQLLEEMFPVPYGRIIPTKRIPVATSGEVTTAFEQLLLEGYEGGVLKNPQGQYVLGRRSPDWLKMKPWISLDLPIIGATEGDGKYAGSLGRLDVEGDCEIDDKMVHLKTGIGTFKIPDAERSRLWALHVRGQLIGKIAEFKIQNMTVEDAGRHGVFFRLREDR